ncbi:MAG: hypothetical protein D6730_07600 [Bacteroidetes bacterium]|nr:MAG: hypothetical protein D6730_07600 [Bacteroidota bacterium]
MQKNIPLSKLGETLKAYIKENKAHNLTEVGQKTLGITYQNFQKRLSKNNLRIYELEQILDYLGLEVQLTIGEMQFGGKPAAGVNYDERLAEEERLLMLEEEQVKLKRQALNVRKQIEQLREEMDKREK